MKEKRSTKMSANHKNQFLKQLKANADDSYYLEVLYYYVRRALSARNFNLREDEGFSINGRFFGYKQEIIFSPIFTTVLKSLGLALSIRAIMLDKSYLEICYDNRLLFYDLEEYFISWDSHRVIMECIHDDDFKQLYDMALFYKKNKYITDEQKEIFANHTVRPAYKNFEVYLRKLACDPDYDGKSVIKENEYLNSDLEDFVVPEDVDYIGNTAFAYCNNLRTITFTRKVLFGYFPIIECNNLKKIIVPDDLVDYYKEKLPYYKGIIGDVDLSGDLDPEILWHVYDKKITSYKYFWFWAILDISYNKKKNSISYMHILAKMIAYAWEYVYLYGYNLGMRDQLHGYMDILKEKIVLNEKSKKEIVEERILELYKLMDLDAILAPLLRNVPYRFLSPWIPFTTNEEVIEKSNEPETLCPYALKDDYILINPHWFEFFNNNYETILNFIKEELKAYIEKNNS